MWLVVSKAEETEIVFQQWTMNGRGNGKRKRDARGDKKSLNFAFSYFMKQRRFNERYE
jgi:hypothetical protein